MANHLPSHFHRIVERFFLFDFYWFVFIFFVIVCSHSSFFIFLFVRRIWCTNMFVVCNMGYTQYSTCTHQFMGSSLLLQFIISIIIITDNGIYKLHFSSGLCCIIIIIINIIVVVIEVLSNEHKANECKE